MDNKITSITDYIDEIYRISKELKKDHGIVVYRGEPDVYPTPGMPGIFRENYLRQNPYFERSLLGEMKVNKLTQGDTWLEMAVDSQHDGMPSRLLDVSYNSLVALYFAVTPFYKGHSESEYDGEKDGHVLVYSFDEIYCPDRKSDITEFFDNIINRKNSIYESYLYQENHKLIDHVKVNQRICVQQGAFILFPGNEFLPVSDKDYHSIVIDRNARADIRKQLSDLFGINTAYIYPEPFNFDKEMIKKSEYVTETIINFDTELFSFFKKMNDEITYSQNEIIKVVRGKSKAEVNKDSLREIIEALELRLLRFKEAVEELKDLKEINDLENLENLKNLEELKGIKDYTYLSENKYDDIKKDYNINIETYCNIIGPIAEKYGITLSKIDLLLG